MRERADGAGASREPRLQVPLRDVELPFLLGYRRGRGFLGGFGLGACAFACQCAAKKRST